MNISKKTLWTPIWFILITFVFSWILWISLILLGPFSQIINISTTIFAAFGPTITGIILISTTTSREERKSFRIRTLHPKLIHWKYYILITIIFPCMYLCAYTLYNQLGWNYPTLEGFYDINTNIFGILGFILIMLISWPLAEELWRRWYLLQKLLKKRSPLLTSIVIAFIRIVRHLPLNFIPNTPQNQMGFGYEYINRSIQVVALSIIITWIFIRNKQSILSAILIHFIANITYSLIIPVFSTTSYHIPLFVDSIVTIFHVLFVLIIICIIERKMFLSRSPRRYNQE